MREWIPDEFERESVNQWERFFNIKFKTYEEYAEAYELLEKDILDYDSKEILIELYPNIEHDIAYVLKEKVECICCGKYIVLEEDEYEKFDGDIYCLDCFHEVFGVCEWCGEYVPHEELAWYGNILCCDDCATNDWEEMEEAHNWR